MKNMFRIIASMLAAVLLIAFAAVPALASGSDNASAGSAGSSTRTFRLNTVPVLLTAVGMLVAAALLIFIMIKLKGR